MNPRTLALTSVTGTIGSRLVPRLAGPGIRLRGLVRDPRRLAPGVDVETVVPSQPVDRPAVARLLRGADAVVVVCGNGPEQVELETMIIDEAVRAGVAHLVKVSARGADPAAPVAFWRWHAEIEQHLAASGLPAVVLQPSFLMTNLFAGADLVRGGGPLVAPAGSAAISMVDPDDVAAVAARAVSDPEAVPAGTLVLTGPAAVTYAEVAAVLSDLVGTDVAYAAVPDEGALAGMVSAGVPAFVAEQIVAVFGALRAGAQETVTSTVAELTGRPAHDLRRFLAGRAAAFGAERSAV